MLKQIVSPPEVVAVLPAAGNGSRMQSDRPKQYLTIGHKTILEHAVAALLSHPRISRAIVVVSPDDRCFHALPIAGDPRVSVVNGGSQRADSVLAGLQTIADAKWVLVHDAARPCLHPDDLERLLSITAQSDVGGILATPVRDTMKRGAGTVIAHTVDRGELWHALTPQLFPLALLKTCLQQALHEGAIITDEASALEYCGYHPQIVSGRADNIKITRPEDLALAEFYLTNLHHNYSTG
ncbi:MULTISPECIES: 2-C-methyl-D-erythritol 4-phosphate cytidylyltransferase [unclassified Brenneria]|uniref:2-C-methyl-D-erythritol 4-phosphate cytidylyltransferase n=1 Tax=unclassified Brenneria TaxID=2634434 RepID=UPI0015523E5C|nr:MULTISPECIES: 2-C-methyl-D-erythritol 4-phosphate cytidylyltransferase [unclassified Brenneria]MBJ7223632.1 2-C-methyl-D-erythritol 4-phosphate cytidylyltransferase [Brenneria sp. L3-3C-1]MEE3644874.1 2-C-methyl-D-erythritol 4-phosphate cytidylyltransferase [Brenneria sp. L3_3C_1]MEE3652377.1 2-C-methyl-D-erythritol 4-phosphate cytidylyltransferase [Brenneria sp. HEZEL_4_2_4]NPD02334.1 2-C-methyl-D-erythritol 4-phosphate cytidylyltransferase [Brenneria sp. hezel4-2-4]